MACHGVGLAEAAPSRGRAGGTQRALLDAHQHALQAQAASPTTLSALLRTPVSRVSRARRLPRVAACRSALRARHRRRPGWPSAAAGRALHRPGHRGGGASSGRRAPSAGWRSPRSTCGCRGLRCPMAGHLSLAARFPGPRECMQRAQSWDPRILSTPTSMLSGPSCRTVPTWSHSRRKALE